MAEHPERPRDISKIHNTLERRAHLIVDMLEDRAQHIVDSMDEPPPGTVEQDPQTIRDMWSFSPFGERATQTFWTLHDLALDKLLGEVNQSGVTGEDKLKAVRQAKQQAETAALSRVYPYRANVMMLGITTIEKSVELANQAQRLVGQESRRTASTQARARMTAATEPAPGAGVY